MIARLDRLGALIAILLAVGSLAPFATLRPNRILPGQGREILDSLPVPAAVTLLVILAAVGLAALARTPAPARMIASLLALTATLVALGLAPQTLAPAANPYARVAPAWGAWLLLFASALLATDAIARLRIGPLARVAALLAALVVLAGLASSGLWDSLSVFKEFHARADTFGAEARRHLALALSSMAAATLVGVPLGILCHRVRAVREPLLGVLNAVQTIPSIALFGLLIAPLGWLAAHMPGAAELGIRGIGAAPAFVALFLYSLLPVAANTVVGLAGVPPDANDAARGLGMTGGQRLARVELPLALPVILTGIRIVLVQNIGLATIAALIGGGGLGVFVFQGIGQTASDLVLLGALPTVGLCFASAVLLDAAVAWATPKRAPS